MIFNLTNEFKEFTAFKKGTIQNISDFYNRIEILISTEDINNIKDEIGIYIYNHQNIPFELLSEEKLYIRSIKENDICVITKMVTPVITNTDPLLTATALEQINLMRSELETIKEIYPPGFSIERDETKSNTELHTVKIRKEIK